MAPENHRRGQRLVDRKSTRLNSSHTVISYAVFCLKKKKNDGTAVASGRESSVANTANWTCVRSERRYRPTARSSERILAVAPSTSFLFFFNDTATTEIYTLSLHDALPI